MACQKLTLTAQHKRKVKFGATPSCQDIVSQSWACGINSSYPLIFLTIFLPVLLTFNSIQSFGKFCGEEVATIGFSMKLRLFYYSSQVKHLIYFMEFMVILALMSYSLIFNLPVATMGVCEGIAVGYIAVLSLIILLEVMTSIVEVGIDTVLALVTTTPFFKYNAVVYIFNWIYMIIRLSPYDNYTVQRTLFAVLLIMCFMRIIEYLSVFRPFGIYIVIMKSMLSDFITFLAIIPIILVPYGIGLQALLFPNTHTFEVGSFFKMFEIPYYNLYGELYLKDINGERDGCTPNGVDCPLNNPVAPIIHLVYIFVGTILLMNLLIAVFSAVYTSLQEQSKDMWMFHRLPICHDWMDKSFLPAPLSLFDEFYNFMRAFVKMIKRKRKAKRLAKALENDDDDYDDDEEEEEEKRNNDDVHAGNDDDDDDVEEDGGDEDDGQDQARLDYEPFMEPAHKLEKLALEAVYSERKDMRFNSVENCLSKSLQVVQSSMHGLMSDIMRLYKEAEREIKAEEEEKEKIKLEQRQRWKEKFASKLKGVAPTDDSAQERRLLRNLRRINDQLEDMYNYVKYLEKAST